MIQSIVWALVILALVGTAIWRVDAQVTASRAYDREQFDAKEKDAALMRQERQAKLDIDTATADERATLAKTQLLQQAAEAEVAAKVAAATVDARIREEEAVIAGRTEGRALAAKEAALAAPAGESDMQYLTDAYNNFVTRTGSQWAFSAWLGSVSLENGRVTKQ